MLLNEVSKLREERRNIQLSATIFSSSVHSFANGLPSEIGTLLCLRSKYEAGGMFDPDW
jgi:hypothetical protein